MSYEPYYFIFNYSAVQTIRVNGEEIMLPRQTGR
jgi:hypothetical protein